MRGKSIVEITEELDIDIAVVKSKWSSLRAQYGRELAKENKSKSGQNTDELYESKWVFIEKLHFIGQIQSKNISNKNKSSISNSFDKMAVMLNQQMDMQIKKKKITKPRSLKRMQKNVRALKIPNKTDLKMY